MRPVFTFDEIRNIEKSIIELEGVPSIVLMENAGKNSCDVLLQRFKNFGDYETYIICGKGNNAGDGYTLARHLIIKGYFVTIVQLVEPAELSGDALLNYNLLNKILTQSDKGEIVFSFDLSFFKKRALLSNRKMFIDAILGTGVKGTLDEKFSNAIDSINNLRTKNKKLIVVSLDVPSGLASGEPAGRVIKADITISMGTYKSELLFGDGKQNSGELNVVPIGITEDLIRKYDSYKKNLVELSDIKMLYPLRKRTSYKYSNGKALIIGGSKGLTGAVVMSSLSALKCGAGGVVAAIPETISPIFNKRLFEIMTLELDATPEGSIASKQFDKLRKRLDWADAVLIGPGISLNEQTREFVYEVIKRCNRNLIIDADALTFLSENLNLLKERKMQNEIILSPHLGEFSRLTGISIDEIQSNRFPILREFAVEYKVNVALKSETTLVCISNGDIYINTSGNESLATIGSGDVLSGILVSLLAQTKDISKALICGNYLHGLCADLYSEKYGNRQTASPQDMIKLIPDTVTFVTK